MLELLVIILSPKIIVLTMRILACAFSGNAKLSYLKLAMQLSWWSLWFSEAVGALFYCK